MTTISAAERFVLLNTLAMEFYKRPRKNFFFSRVGDGNWTECLALEAMGYLCRKQPGPMPPCVEFNATVDGVQFAMGLVQREAIERWLATGKWGKKREATR